MVEVSQRSPKMTALELFDVDLQLITTVKKCYPRFIHIDLFIFFSQWVANFVTYLVILQQFLSAENWSTQIFYKFNESSRINSSFIGQIGVLCIDKK